MSDHDVLFAISNSASASASASNSTPASTTTAAATAPSHGGSSSSSKSHHKHHNHHHHHHNHHKSHGNKNIMAPTPDNDQGSNASSNPNKAPPDKSAKGNRGDPAKDEKVSVPRTVDDLNDGELRALLDEAANYKNPKDREGKSKLFNHLLMEAEETERNARASRAGGSELVRYHNPSAARRGGTRHRNKKRSSVSENMMHGGSLDNLAKETLYETSKSRAGKKSVSARQREGGSLPCNVNAPNAIKVECVEFLEEEARRRKIRNEPTTQQQAIVTAAAASIPTKNEYHRGAGVASCVVNMEPDRFTFMNHHDVTDKQQQQLMNSINHQFSSSSMSTTMPIEIVHYPVAQHAKFTSMASLHVNGGNGNGSGGGLGGPRNNNNNNNVDDAIQLGPLELPTRAKNNHSNSSSSSNNNNSTSSTNTTLEEIEELKKVDENDNEKDNKEGEEGGEDPDKAKDEADKKKDKDKEKKKKTGERNVTVCKAHQLKGYNPAVASSSVKSILKFVGERSDIPDRELRLNPPGRSARKKGKKDQTNSKAGDKLKKSNSMGEISTADFEEEDEVRSRNKSVDRRERRSWSEIESPMPNLLQQKQEQVKQQQQQQQQQQEQQILSQVNSETADFQLVTKKKDKKKNRERRRSLGTSGIDSSGGHSSGGGGGGGGGGHHHHHHHHNNNNRGHNYSQRGDYSGRKSSEDGHSYSQSGSSYAASSVSESGSGLKSGGKPKAARSAPQSDKSDSCSDADSVHSLPISAVVPSAHEISKAAAATASGADGGGGEAATKAAKVLSYADMARNGDASCRTKQQRTSFGTKIMTNYASGNGGNNGGDKTHNSDNSNNNNKVQPKVERRKSPEPGFQGEENEEEANRVKVEKQQQQQEEKQEPPDVTSIKSFPAIKSPLEKNHSQLSVSGNFSNVISNSNKGKTQKIDASTNTGQTTTNAWNNRGNAASAATTPNNSGSDTGGGLTGFENVSGSYAVYNKLPPDIPDVQSIEKMQLLSQGHPYEESNSTISTANTTPIPSITSNVSGTGAGSAIITSTPKTGTATNDCSLDCDISEKRTLKNNNNNINNNIKIGVSAAAAGVGCGDINVLSSVRDDDNSSSSGSSRHYEDRNLGINESGLEAYQIEEGEEEEGEYDVDREDAAEEEETHRLQLLSERQQQQRPPVVILSGGEPKEVSGLVFGFDINEQLLNEGRSVTVEEFSASFVMPSNFSRTSHNHDDIVKYVHVGWNDFSTSNNVKVYSPDMD